MTYRPLPGGGVAEVAPTHCPAGHLLKYPNLSIGWDGQHRTYTCNTCWDVIGPKAIRRYRTGPQPADQSAR